MLKLCLFFSCLVSSIYSIHYTDINGSDQGFASYEGKKILIVNIATNSNHASQLTQLQTLYEQYHDSLEIIAFPSNSFGHEPRTNAEIKTFCENTYGVTFKLSAKGAVTGSDKLAIYNWLASINENGALNGIVVGDFQKFLISRDGALIGVFAPSIAPLDTILVNAITENY